MSCSIVVYLPQIFGMMRIMQIAGALALVRRDAGGANSPTVAPSPLHLPGGRVYIFRRFDERQE
jgi:hypothetical protein